jgi:polyphosphate kinase
VRREDGGLRRYAHIGTGNYHVNNARLYTDYSLLTAHEGITEDVHKVFMQLTGLGKVSQLKHLYQSPFTLFPSLRKWIAQETAKAKKGEEAWILAKMNSLSDEGIIQDLYTASQAGVKIRLLVRGICCLRPGIAGLSENIEVRSILGRMLEHHRAYAFSSGEVYIASSDWMERNLHRRVEVCCPILDLKLKNRILFELRSVFWRDNQQSWRMLSDGSYQPIEQAEEPFWSQQYFMDDLGE